MSFTNTPYSVLASLYENWQSDSDPVAWADFADDLIRKFGMIRKGQGKDGRLLLADLGCGTGTIAALMAGRGYDVLGIDTSPEMLAEARRSYTYNDISFVCQDISAMDLYGTVDAMICFMDTVNHLTDIRKLKSFFKSCKTFLNPGGVLIFDIATEKHFTMTLGNKTFAEDGADHAIIWNNSFNKTTALNKSSITVFSRVESGLYERTETEIKERYYSADTIASLIAENDLAVKAVYADLKKKKPGNTSERIFFVVLNENDPRKENLVLL